MRRRAQGEERKGLFWQTLRRSVPSRNFPDPSPQFLAQLLQLLLFNCCACHSQQSTVSNGDSGKWQRIETVCNAWMPIKSKLSIFSETEMFSWSAQFEEMAIIRSYSWKYHSCPFPLWQGRWEIWLEMVRHADFTCFTRQLGLLLLPQWTQSA